MGLTVGIEEAQQLRGQLRHWAYNALDVTGTLEIAEVLLPRLDDKAQRTYAFERACQSPAITMMRRGVRVDTVARSEAITELKRDLRKASGAIDKLPIVAEVWDGTELETGFCPKGDLTPSGNLQRHKWPRGVDDDDPAKKCERCGCSRKKRQPFNANSPPQTDHLLHDLFGLKRMRNKKGEFSCDEFVLESLGRKNPKYKSVTGAILKVRGLKKQIGFLNSKLSADGRFHSSFNVGAAWTGRWSSSKDPFGRGGNLQNVAERHRHMFVADAGMKLCYADLEQAESRTVAYVAGDEAYIEAHLTGDVHTAVCRLVWPELPWTGDIKEDKKVANINPEWDQAPGHGYRFQAKRIQHGLNYGLTPQGVSAWAHIPLNAAKEIYNRYFSQFPYIKEWQAKMARLVAEQEELENPLGRTCRLFGRPWDGHTVKQALAFIPQSTVADVINLSIWQVWKECDPDPIQLLAQVHDAIFCQYRIEAEEVALNALRDIMTIEVPIGERVMVIPVEVAVGQNWGKKNTDPEKGRLNPHGLETV